MKEYMNSPAYQVNLRNSSNKEIVDALWMYSKQIADNDNRIALSIMMDTVRGGNRTLYGETKEEADIRLISLPSGLEGDYTIEYGNRDKLQHFFKSAQISYHLSISEDIDIGQATVSVLGHAKEVSDEFASTGYDENDIKANSLGAAYGKHLRRYENLPSDTYPSYVLHNQ